MRMGRRFVEHPLCNFIWLVRPHIYVWVIWRLKRSRVSSFPHGHVHSLCQRHCHFHSPCLFHLFVSFQSYFSVWSSFWTSLGHPRAMWTNRPARTNNSKAVKSLKCCCHFYQRVIISEGNVMKINKTLEIIFRLLVHPARSALNKVLWFFRIRSTANGNFWSRCTIGDWTVIFPDTWNVSMGLKLQWNVPTATGMTQRKENATRLRKTMQVF